MNKLLPECNNKPRICFVAHLAYGAMAGGDCGAIGGVERQTSLMAKWLAGRGYQVSVLTWDEGQEDGIEIDGVKVFKLCRKDAGIKGLRFFWPKWTSLIAAMKRADADVYYHNCSECVTGQIALWCRMNNRRFIYSTASDRDCELRLPHMHTYRERVLYRYGLKSAETVIVQTERQREMMLKNFRRDSLVLPMPCPGPSEIYGVNYEQERHSSRHVLWIGRICKVKRPDRLLDLAENCSDLHFDLVGPSDYSEYARAVCERARNIENLTLHGSVSRENVSEYYKKAKIMCCTSDSEGFPNTFLEAWSYALPIVSTFDPGGMIADIGLGIIAQEISGLADGIRSLCNSPDQWKEVSQRVRQYYLENHTVDAAMEKFERAFASYLHDSRS